MHADDTATHQSPTLPLDSTGVVMARARVAAGLDLPALSAKTRIRIDHLKALEEGNLASLPGRTYVFGFARSYARAVGMDEAKLLAAIRHDYDGTLAEAEAEVERAFVPGDPARAPSSRFAWIAGGVALVAGLGGLAVSHDWSGAAGQLPSLLPKEAPAPSAAKPAAATPAKPAAPAPTPALAAGAVVFTAQTDKLWVKFYDAAGTQLMQKQMAKGETYTVPATAHGPRIWTGRPDALTITIGGRPVAKLSDEDRKIKDVPVDAASLLARGLAAPASPPVAAPVHAPVVAPAMAPTMAPTMAPHPAAASPAHMPAPAPPPNPSHTPAHTASHHPTHTPSHPHHDSEATVPGSAGEIVHGGAVSPAPAGDGLPKPALSTP